MVRVMQVLRESGWALFLLCLSVSPALGAEAFLAEGPMLHTQEILQSSNIIVTGPGERDAKLVKLKVLLRDFLDTDALGRRSMGKHLKGVTPEQEARFLSLFRDLFVRTYVQRLLLFDVPEFSYGDERISGDTAEVETEIVTERDRFGVDYDLRKTKDGWAATDIRIEDVSLGANFRSQFDRALSKDTLDGLLDRLDRKLHGKKPPASSQ
jgi:phospholipid transport system substrate-binding protein